MTLNEKIRDCVSKNTKGLLHSFIHEDAIQPLSNEIEKLIIQQKIDLLRQIRADVIQKKHISEYIHKLAERQKELIGSLK